MRPSRPLTRCRPTSSSRAVRRGRRWSSPTAAASPVALCQDRTPSRSTSPASSSTVGVTRANRDGRRRSSAETSAAAPAASVSDNRAAHLGTPGGSIGVVAYGDSDVRAVGNVLSGFGRGGIGANGDGGAHPSPRIVVRDNVIDAQSATGGSAPNGVRIGFGASGQVRGNTVRNCRYAADLDGLFQASGVLIFESDGVVVQGNSLENNDVAVAASAWAGSSTRRTTTRSSGIRSRPPSSA
ncbi:MAG: right-handed parallel beta-helix repeat-containing protein [Halobacteriales archaeon]|nr:right-handed parallel beta-helix repeat-containing protein [Halobacteriales archaeon]